MPSRHLSVRLHERTFEHLDAVARRAGASRSQLVQRLVDEGLRMEEHPGIVFRAGPSGRRAGLDDGPDVWEVIRALEGIDVTDERALAVIMEATGLRRDQIERSLSYYRAFPDEIDEWIREERELIARLRSQSPPVARSA